MLEQYKRGINSGIVVILLLIVLCFACWHTAWYLGQTVGYLQGRAYDEQMVETYGVTHG